MMMFGVATYYRVGDGRRGVRAIITRNEWGECMSMLCNSTMDHQMDGMDARSYVQSRALPSSLRPNLFSGD